MTTPSPKPADESLRTTLFGQDDTAESEADLPSLQPSQVTEAVVTATDWTTETIIAQLRRGNIDLKPAFQRRDAWTDIRKSKFIESLFLGLPVPQIVLAERKDRRGSFLVIDGKQRLLTLMQFAADFPESQFQPLRLRGLDIKTSLNGKTLRQIEQGGDFAEDLNAFHNQTIRTVVVKNWPTESFLYLVFLRLNTGSVALSPQELRQALHPGPFVEFADEFAQESNALQSLHSRREPDFRMRDTEMLVRYFALTWFLDQYAGNMKSFLDSTCQQLNEGWVARESAIRDHAASCEAAIRTTQQVFGDDDAFSRWRSDGFEQRFNRAVFDIMSYYFRHPETAALAVEKRAEVIAAFKHLCETDATFASALQVTTKSIPSMHSRLERWGGALSKAIGIPLRIPSLTGSRIGY